MVIGLNVAVDVFLSLLKAELLCGCYEHSGNLIKAFPTYFLSRNLFRKTSHKDFNSFRKMLKLQVLIFSQVWKSDAELCIFDIQDLLSYFSAVYFLSDL